ncbi:MULTISPECIES: hypothetical protein [Pseudomonas]|uniref:hypothetical protein n=1 Tax=Pseudomonas TaxID=286 RepID=UPI0013DF7C49|nr:MULTISPECIES: hypothetical protein [Pseudomonas]MCE0912018.1 hypothetical protein [Pseudomonas kurunegalensis]QIG17809.1 hypothetical protein FY041_08550 [Pseudomonas monteilii]QIG23066.1 hypothetical protein FY043_08545 [Pseudomonas monteilii]WJR57554.1 hypothetical protein LU664_008355 [Pseudomonas kurunegalensis]
MAQELTDIAVAGITAVSMIIGFVVNWGLNSISADTAARRTEKTDRRKSIEDRYLSVQTSVELFLRSKIRGSEMDKDLAHLNSIIALFADQAVREAFNGFQHALIDFYRAIEGSPKKHVYLTDAAEDFREEWNDLIRSQEAISSAMRDHIDALRSFKD